MWLFTAVLAGRVFPPDPAPRYRQGMGKNAIKVILLGDSAVGKTKYATQAPPSPAARRARLALRSVELISHACRGRLSPGPLRLRLPHFAAGSWSASSWMGTSRSSSPRSRSHSSGTSSRIQTAGKWRSVRPRAPVLPWLGALAETGGRCWEDRQGMIPCGALPGRCPGAARPLPGSFPAAIRPFARERAALSCRALPSPHKFLFRSSGRRPLWGSRCTSR